MYKTLFCNKRYYSDKIYTEGNTYWRNRSKFSLKEQLKTLKHPTRRILVVGTNSVFTYVSDNPINMCGIVF